MIDIMTTVLATDHGLLPWEFITANAVWLAVLADNR